MEHSETIAISSDPFVLRKSSIGPKSNNQQREKHVGVDGELWSTPAAKMRGVLTLSDKGYKAKPLRRVFIEKKEKRPSGYWASLVCMTGPCKHSTHWPLTQYPRQQQT